MITQPTHWEGKNLPPLKGGPAKLVPGRFGRSLAEVWGLTPAEVAAEYERLKRFPNAVLTKAVRR